MDSIQEIPDELLTRYGWKMGGDYYYPMWTQKEGPIEDKSRYDFFTFTEPIGYHSIKEPTGKKEKANQILPNILPNPETDYKQGILAESGYLRPHFRFVSLRTFPFKEDVDSMVVALRNADDEDSEIELLNKLTAYRDSLLKQIKRQAEKVHEINKQIASILKVYYHETSKVIDQESNLSQKENQEIEEIIINIRYLFTEGILEGAYLEDIKNHWLSDRLRSNRYISEYIREGVIRGIELLAEKREPYLKVAEMLAKKINNLESIIEILITGDELTGTYYKRRNMPDPQVIAKRINSRKYETSLIAEVMTITREYILRENIEDVYNHVDPIKEEVKDHDISEPSKNTLRDWIKLYCEACGVL